MSQVVFYLLNDTDSPAYAGVATHFLKACNIAAFYYAQQKKVFIYTENQQDAFAVDECLWQFDGDSFVPHNLKGEGPKFGTPVEISWQTPTHPRPILINLSHKVPEFAINFQQIIDFVPAEPALKEAARARYSHYKKLGLTLATKEVQAIPTESTN